MPTDRSDQTDGMKTARQRRQDGASQPARRKLRGTERRVVLEGVGYIVAATFLVAAFMAITQLSLVTGTALGTPRTVALLTAGYGLGQVAGPPAVRPVLSHGYRPALAISGGVLLAAAVCAAPLMRRAADPAPA
ncbi:hypothetical protein [Streptomyces sp. NPDC001404]|uniref:hypothetical protein n=1 Tax=Streptomyces sp. NPDC001404 TaxID=3364571 RepID=UPI0036A4BA16